MTLSIERPSLELLAALLLERAGLKITPDGYYGLRLALQARMPALGITDATEYVGRLKQRAGEQELRSLIPLVTVGKTEFFRDTRQFLSFERHVLPQVMERGRLEQRQTKLWSAGCATGEEPYSLSMVALERGETPATVDIWATDLNPAATESASRAFFPARRLVGVSEDRIQRFFTTVEGGYQLVQPVRELIRFEGHNLAAPVWHQVQARSLDVIFCRNVIIYFDQPTIVGVMERFYESLRPGGWMFLGYSESLFKISTRFEMVEVGGTFAYQRPLNTIRKPPAPVTTVARPSAPPPPPRSPTDVESVLRKLKLQEPPKPPRPSAPPPPPRPPVRKTPVERLAEVVEAIEKGDFPKALRTVRRLADEEPDDLAARLTLGNVHALMGNLDEAREAYQYALSREALCVEARLYTALAEMQGGQLDDAKQELTRALFLEPTLAVGHYLLGQVNERRGDVEGALRAYRNAISQRKQPRHELIGHFPDLPRSNEAIAQAAQYRLAALSER
ncbi:MAG: CheR family methyltransferase [Archangium sp.]|nr:CheR family methyltransferase [Archangium sp.]